MNITVVSEMYLDKGLNLVRTEDLELINGNWKKGLLIFFTKTIAINSSLLLAKKGYAICFAMKDAIIAVNTNYPKKSDYQLVDAQNSRVQLQKLNADSNWSFCLRALIRSKIIYYEFDGGLTFSSPSLRRNKYSVTFLLEHDSKYSLNIFQRTYTFTGRNNCVLL